MADTTIVGFGAVLVVGGVLGVRYAPVIAGVEATYAVFGRRHGDTPGALVWLWRAFFAFVAALGVGAVAVGLAL